MDLTPLEGARDGQLDGQQGRRPLGRLGSSGSSGSVQATEPASDRAATTAGHGAPTAACTSATSAASAASAAAAASTSATSATSAASAAAASTAAPVSDDPADAASLSLTRAVHLLRAGRVEETLAALDALTADPDPRTDGARAGLPVHLEVAALATALDAHLCAGDLGSALDVGRALRALDTSAPLGPAPTSAGTTDVASTSGAAPGGLMDPHPEAVRQHALAELCAASGDHAGAVEHASAAGRLAPDAAPADLPWRASLAMALARAGRRGEAEALVGDHLAAADRAGSTYARAGALRTRASLLAGPERTARLEEARALLTGRPDLARLAAQVDVDLAGVLALTPGGAPRAVALLRTAEAFASTHGLWPLHGRVRRLLEHLGESPRRIAAEVLAPLGARERRVAGLAMAGSTNRQVAEELGVTVKAVEWHLSRVYRKLGVTSRTGLRALLEG
ncbi:LuxR family transcriptional regulator [Nocardioides sp. Leaf285]|uniref:LuxR family transcriptional regulator n=1 Tax=Nocardioides sp. Leaf285 TaxID=1736322 RepID=UPI0009E9E0D7|nr:LuxR family transcriptional regulator [Nocardioides sp. Leaf285]